MKALSPMQNLSLLINKAKTQEELDRIEKQYPKAFDHEGGLKWCLANARNTVRHIETIRYYCQTYAKN